MMPKPFRSPVQTRLLSLLSALLILAGPALAAENLQDVINQANAAANREDYPTATRLYEQIVQKSPADKTLKGNLAVLYANYGVTLEEQKKFDEALACFDKALALVPADSKEARQFRDGKAGTLFTKAIALRDENPTPTPEQTAQVKALLEQALALNPDEPNIKKGMASVYLDEAYPLAVEEKYAEARPLLEKALTYDPNYKSVRQSLANVYLGLAKNEPDHRKDWIDKALALDNSPRMQQIAAQLQAGPPANAAGFGQVVGGFANAPGEAKGAAPRQISQLSVADMLHDMENQLSITPPKDAKLMDRLETLEKQVLGKTQTGALATRTKTVYTSLMGSYDGTTAESNPNLVQAPALVSADSYLDEIFKVTDGKVIRWGKFPLRVYIEEPKDEAAVKTLYKPEYKEAVLHGLNAWKVKTNGFANYVEVKNPDAADIVIGWTDKYVDRFADPDKLPAVYKNYAPPKRNPLVNVLQMASMFAPGYFSLAPQALAAGLQYKQMKQLEVIREESKIKLGLDPTRDLATDKAALLVQNMAAKEFGHALGLKGSSSREGDLLYPELRSDIAQLPSTRDLETLRELYNRPPNIILNVH